MTVKLPQKHTTHSSTRPKFTREGRYSAALKEKVSLEALKGEKTLQQIASENNISPELVRQWKKQAQEGVSQIFKRSKSREKLGGTK